MDCDNPPPPIFPTTDNDQLISDTDLMRSYAIDTLFDSAYYIGDTEEIETAEALRAPDRDQFILAIKKEVHSLISETATLQPLTRTTSGYAENIGNKRIWKIRTTLKCKRKKKSTGEPDKHKARAAARGDTLRRAMIKANVPIPASYSPTIMPLTFSPFLQLAVIQKLHMATMDIKSAYLNAALPPDADWTLHWNPISRRCAAWTRPKNTASRTRCTAYSTLADFSTSTTKPPSLPKDMTCPHLTTAYSTAQPPPKLPTLLSTSTIRSHSATPQPTLRQ